MQTLEKLSEAAERGLHKLTVYRGETGAWHAVALGKTVQGSAVFRTPEAAADGALDELLSKMGADTAAEEDIFG